MPTYPGNGADSANSRHGEHVTGSSHGNDPMAQDRLHGMALPVTTSIAHGGPMPTPQLATGVTWPDVCPLLARVRHLYEG